MAYLKSSQITGLSAKDVDVKGFTQTANIKLGDRAYTEHEVLLADSYSIVGDVNVSENLILSKLSDDGDDITITGDTTTRTISGSGSIEGATLAQTPNATMTGMTGTVGSGVTIVNAVTFPAGMIINVTDGSISTQTTVSTTTYEDVLTVTPTLKKAGNKYLLRAVVPVYHYTGQSTVGYWLRIYRTTATATTISEIKIHRQNETNTGECNGVVLEGFDISPVSVTEYKVQLKSNTADSYPIWCYDNKKASLIIQKIQV